MSNERIGFLHPYDKLHGQTSAKLLEVTKVDMTDVPEATLVYDCSCNGTVVDMPDTDPELYRLTLIGNLGIPFTTYRRITPELTKKYVNSVGKIFGIYVNEKGTTNGQTS